MKTPSLTRVKILKFMLSRIDQSLSSQEVQDGSHSNYKNTMNEIRNLVNDSMITKTKIGYKLSLDNYDFIITKYTELAVVCNFKNAMKEKMKQTEIQENK
jgi:predicted transcriptional regulator